MEVRCSSRERVYEVKAVLKEKGWLDRSIKVRQLERNGDKAFAIPVLPQAVEEWEGALPKELLVFGDVLELAAREGSGTCSRASRLLGTHEKLRALVHQLWEKERLNDPEHFDQECLVSLLNDLPKGWDRYGDFVLLPEQGFTHSLWDRFGDSLWPQVAAAFGAIRIGRKARIPKEDGMRLPRIKLLLGTDPWVTHADNGIKCSWNITRSMFSSGNGTEKKRVAQLDSRGMTVVDLYAGIGYFTLPYLVHGKAKFVYACEWNPDAVEALKRNLLQNGVSDRCEVLLGDNATTAPEGVADRINLGLIPTSEPGWPVAVRCLRKDIGGWMHIHQNVTEGEEHVRAWEQHMCKSLVALLEESTGIGPGSWSAQVRHVEHVKSYAPHINHLVADVECRPAASEGV